MTYTIAIAGATGYVGGELLRLLLGHPEIEIGALTAGASAGSTVGEHHPHLVPLFQRAIVETTAENLSGHDVVFLALPHGTSAEVAALISDDTLVVDCGADFRLEDASAWEEFYGSEHAGTWAYGLPELAGQREKLAGVKRIAGPGCFPTVSSLAAAPALGLVDPEFTIVAPTAPSGAGKKLATNLLGSEILGQASAYGVGGVHRHTPEIEQNLRAMGAENPVVSFTPVLVPMSRGILAVVSAPAKSGVTAEDVRAAYDAAYADEHFVHVLPEGTWPQTQATIGANTVLIQATLDERAGKVIAVAAMDNLAKGTAGGAIQSMNIALGLTETLGLTTIGVAP